MSLVKCIKFISYSWLPKRISASLTICMRLMEGSKGKITMIIRKMRRRSPYPWNDVYLWETLMVLMVQDPKQVSQ